jgi:heat shock factor-binding protein 1
MFPSAMFAIVKIETIRRPFRFPMSAAADQVPTQPEDLANFMDQIFTQMEQKFTDMAQQVLGRIDEMSAKINELEGAIDHLMSEADPDQKGP